MKKPVFKQFPFLIVFIFYLFFSNAPAEPLLKTDVPEPLRPWVDWVLKGSEEKLCPSLYGDEEQHICQWPSLLELKIDEKSGEFSQKWSLYKDGFILLPGDSDHWPQNLKIDNKPATPVLRDEKPALYLKKGEYSISGNFLWDSIPESFQIPSETGILNLSVKGKKIEFPNRDAEGRLWLQATTESKFAEDRLEIRVHRRIDDQIPLELTTQISLEVSGKTREVLLNKALPDDFIPTSLTSPLPVKFEADGNLKVQLRPGSWKIELKARGLKSISAIQTPPGKELWAQEEVWVFQSYNNIRLVTIEGVPAIDPQQTTLPDEWKSLPAYRIKPGETIRLSEKRRGDSDPTPDQLSLSRDLWLDFDGRGFTLSDDVSGILRQSSRLEMNSPIRLGRVSVDGKDQLITSLEKDQKTGVEIRQSNLNLTADSRLEGALRKFSAVGWNHNFQKVSAVLHLPPGWRLFSVSGTDHVPNSWINQWSLLDLFLLMIITLAAAKLWGNKLAFVALLTLALIFPEKESPHWIWIALLAGQAVLPLLPQGKLQFVLKLYRGIVFIILLAVAIPFMIQQLREGTYPALENPQQVLQNETFGEFQRSKKGFMNADFDKVGGNVPNQMPAPESPPKMKKESDKPDVRVQDIEPTTGALAKRKINDERAKKTIVTSEESLGFKNRKDYQSELNLQGYQPGAQVQTGPGLPRWEWKEIPLQWNGPVNKDQTIRFILFSPFVNFSLSILRVLLLAYLILSTFNLFESFKRFVCKKQVVSVLLFFVFSSLFFVSSVRAENGFPPAEILNELKNRLLEAPQCAPECASVSRMSLEASQNLLRIRLEVGAQSSTAVPIPGSSKEWIPERIMVDGQNFSGIKRLDDETLYLLLSPGTHQVVLEGSLPERETVQLALPLKPYRVEAKADGWNIEGIHENGISDDNLQLIRTQSSGKENSQTFQSGNLPPFVRVERNLILGLNWEVETHVIRVTTGSPVVLEVPLLEGESVTTPEVRVENRKVKVSLAPQTSDFSWRSVLQEKSSLNLKASDSSSWMEVWQLNVSPLWHVDWKGIPAVRDPNSTNWFPEWHPWPGEELNLQITRPQAIAGSTLTIEQTLLILTPGLRTTDATLSLNLRSSLGGQHSVTLPEKAELQSVTINGMVQPIRQSGKTVTLPIVPGMQKIDLHWQEPTGIRFLYKTASIDLGSPSVNSETQIRLSNNRWVLFTHGPQMGPAVLFWSLLVVLILASFVLNKLPLSPLKLHEWILLGLGLSQVPILLSILVAGWFLALAWRKNHPIEGKYKFNLFQILLIFWTIATLGILIGSIYDGLLGYPNMMIAGNGSSESLLRWFQDRTLSTFPQSYVISIPLFGYRLAMLSWALWIAWALLKWLKWGWKCYGESTVWKPIRK